MALVLLENGLGLDLNLFTDHHAAGDRRVEADAEVVAVDLAACGEAGPGAAVRVGRSALPA
jgi:hypothetical protein